MNYVPLGELVTIKGGGTPDRSNNCYWGGTIPWASVKDFKEIDLRSTSESITSPGLSKSVSNLIPAGSVIVLTRMAKLKGAINSIKVAINQDLKVPFPRAMLYG